MGDIVKLNAKQAARIAAQVKACTISGVEVRIEKNNEVHIFFPLEVDNLERYVLERTLTSFGCQSIEIKNEEIEIIVKQVDLNLNDLNIKKFKETYQAELEKFDGALEPFDEEFESLEEEAESPKVETKPSEVATEPLEAARIANIVKLDVGQAAEIAAQIASCKIEGVDVKVRVKEGKSEVHIFFPLWIDGLERQALEQTLISFGYQFEIESGSFETIIKAVDLDLNNLKTRNFKDAYQKELAPFDVEFEPPEVESKLLSEVKMIDAKSKEAAVKLIVEIGKLNILEIRTEIIGSTVRITPRLNIEVDKLHFEALEKALRDYPFNIGAGKKHAITIFNPENLDPISPDKLQVLYQQALNELAPRDLARKDLIRFFQNEMDRLPKDNEKRNTYSNILWNLENFSVDYFKEDKIIQLCNQFLDEAQYSDNPKTDYLRTTTFFSLMNVNPIPLGIENMKTLIEKSPHLTFAKEAILKRIGEIEKHIKTEGPYVRSAEGPRHP